MAPSLKLMSPRLPGVQILSLDCTPTEYQRWRRAVQSAMNSISPDSWQHCDGSCSCPMPIPADRCSPRTEPQPQLFEERRAWVRKDRLVKLDLWLSISPDIQMDLFEVGPPLPPSAPTASQMLDELDERFSHYAFDDFHHAFSYFLNLHLDSFEYLDDFNAEFRTALREMEDYGQPLNNTQACSAYFSKLRCCQNPWVAQKIKEWDTLEDHPTVESLMQEAPKWIIVKPLEIRHSTGCSGDTTLVGNESDGELEVEADIADKISLRPERLQQTLERLQDQQLQLESYLPKEIQPPQQPHDEEITIHARASALHVSQPPPRNPLRASVKPAKPPSPPQDRPLPPLPPQFSLFPPTRPQTPRSRTPISKASRPTTPIMNISRPTTPIINISRSTTPIMNISPAHPTEPSVSNTSRLRPKLAELKLPHALRIPSGLKKNKQSQDVDTWNLLLQGTVVVDPPVTRVVGLGGRGVGRGEVVLLPWKC